MFADIGSDAAQELMTGHLSGGMAQVAADQPHRLSSVAAEDAMAIVSLRGRPVDDGAKVRGDDDAVLAFLLRVLRDEALLDDGHDACCLMYAV